MKKVKKIFYILIMIYFFNISNVFANTNYLYSKLTSLENNINIKSNRYILLGDASGDTIDEIISGADDFLNSGGKVTHFKVETMQGVTDLLYNIFLGIGMVIAVIVGIILGIKFMISSSQEKAEIKEALIAYTLGCVIVFGAFGIWKIAIIIIS